jgi:hypothetical protein
MRTTKEAIEQIKQYCKETEDNLVVIKATTNKSDKLAQQLLQYAIFFGEVQGVIKSTSLQLKVGEKQDEQ